jgi:hypothetical protein
MRNNPLCWPGFKIRSDLIACCEMATTLGFADERRMRKKPSKENNEEDKKIVNFRRHWVNCYGKYFGSFEDTSNLI